jgi:hypothetical protein
MAIHPAIARTQDFDHDITSVRHGAGHRRPGRHDLRHVPAPRERARPDRGSLLHRHHSSSRCERPRLRLHKQGELVTIAVKYTSLYDQRVNLVKDTLLKHSKLGEKNSLDLAERILNALDHIPEKVR